MKLFGMARVDDLAGPFPLWRRLHTAIYRLMAWLYLILAGLLEAGWAIGLKYTDGFTRPIPSILTAAAIIISMVLLSFAARTLPIGSAYAIWVGIGTVGAVVLGMILFDEPRSPGRIFFLLLLIVALVGLKLTSSSDEGSGTPPDSSQKVDERH